VRECSPLAAFLSAPIGLGPSHAYDLSMLICRSAVIDFAQILLG
jgi:hypothetical protein